MRAASSSRKTKRVADDPAGPMTKKQTAPKAVPAPDAAAAARKPTGAAAVAEAVRTTKKPKATRASTKGTTNQVRAYLLRLNTAFHAFGYAPAKMMHVGCRMPAGALGLP